MTRKLRPSYFFRVALPFISVLVLLIVFVALAPMTGVTERPSQYAVVSAQQNSGVQAQMPQLPWSEATSAPPAPLMRLQRKRVAAPTDANRLLLYLAGRYDSGGWGPSSVAIADLNGDGKLDLVVADVNYVGVLLGNGDGSFQLVGAVTAGGDGPNNTVAIGDVNGDGHLDLVVAVYSQMNLSTVDVFFGGGDGTFQFANSYSSGGSEASAVALSDVNRDGHLDIVVANGCKNYDPVDNCNGGGIVSVLLNDGDGNFHGAVDYSSGGYHATSVAIADLNGDGRPEIVIGNTCGDTHCSVEGNAGVLLGNGDGTFQPAVSYGSGGVETISVAVGDLNGDGHPDLVLASCSQSPPCIGVPNVVGVLLGKGDGTFKPAVTYIAGGSSGPVAIADVNVDGHPDLVSGADLVGVLLGNGDGTFQAAVAYDAGAYDGPGRSLVVRDVNSDGKPDVIVPESLGRDQDGRLNVLLNNSGAPPTATALVSSANPVGIGQWVTYRVSVTSQSGKELTGSVMLRDGYSKVASIGLNTQYSTSYRWIGKHAMTATYSGDAQNAGSVSDTLIELVEYSSKTAVTTSGSPSFVGQFVTFTATVRSKYGRVPDGELVTFYDGKATLGSASLAGGKATFTTSSLSAKTHAIKASYAGDQTFAPSNGKVTQLVLKYATTTTLTSSLNPSNYGQPVSFTATVTGSGPYPPTGKVKFWDGTASLGTAALNNGIAKLTKFTLSVGTHAITAQYLSDAYNDKSTSTVVNQVVQ